jgi:hypothetical protein
MEPRFGPLPRPPLRLKELERTQNAAGRHIFGRGGGANVIEEAVRGDLGWLTMESRVTLAKLRFYGCLCRLSDTRLVKIIFQHCQSEMEVYLQTHNELPPVNSSWCASIYHALCTLNLMFIELQRLMTRSSDDPQSRLSSFRRQHQQAAQRQS